MEDITLQSLLEAGCHFGHKAERWHPKASDFIYTEKDGVHIIDLAKTKAGLEAAMEYVSQVVRDGGEVLFVGTKRQARGVVKEEAMASGAPFFSERWIGGFLTNWDSIKKNIDKIIRLTDEQASGAWKIYPKHERTKLARYLERLKVSYEGVLKLSEPPKALFVVDVKKEIAAVREAKRQGVTVVAIVDTNADPVRIDYVIPANDDAVGSIQFIAHAIGCAYREGKQENQKRNERESQKQDKQEKQIDSKTVRQIDNKKEATMDEESIAKKDIEEAVETVNAESVEEKPAVKSDKIKPKRGRPKKVV